MPELDAEFFMQGECNCKKCRDERKQVAASTCITLLEKEIPFLPANYDIKQGFNGREFPGKEKLEAEVNSLIEANRRLDKKFKKESTTNIRFCADCGTLHVKDKEYKVTRDGKVRYLCPKCVKATYFKCHKCKGNLTQKRVGFEVDGEWYCKDCVEKFFRQCPHCAQYFKKKSMIMMNQHPQIRDWAMLCPKCFDELTIECEDCHIRIRRQDASEYRGMKICKNCKEKSKPIKSYSYKPMPMFSFGKAEKHRDDKYYFGWELEMEFKRINGFNLEQYAEELMDLVGRDRIYMKADSSINNDYGFEIVSHPMSWQKYREEREEVWGKFFKFIEEKRGNNDNKSCGFHVHINKRCFTTMHIYKFIDFFYKHINNTFIVDMSSRGGYTPGFRSYANLHNDRFGDEREINTKKWAKNKSGTSHHAAVDVCPPSTYEVRIFAGTNEAPVFHKNLEFLYALYLYTRDTSLLYNTVPHFTRWLLERNHHDQFRNLVKYIASRRKLLVDYGIYDLFKGVTV